MSCFTVNKKAQLRPRVCHGGKSRGSRAGTERCRESNDLLVDLRRVRTMSLSGETIVAGSQAEEQEEAPAAKKATRDDEPIRVRARDGEEITMSREVARLAGHLKDLMDDASSED